MSRKRAIIKGTFILTLTGFATRFMGFFYRIFLSHTFGEEGVGLYQLVFPIYALCFSLTCAGIELAPLRCRPYDAEQAAGSKGTAAYKPLSHRSSLYYYHPRSAEICRPYI